MYSTELNASLHHWEDNMATYANHESAAQDPKFIDKPKKKLHIVKQRLEITQQQLSQLRHELHVAIIHALCVML
jgi:hypothetical protein